MTRQEVIKEIKIDKANLQHIAETGNINGSLLVSIEIALKAYAEQEREKAFNEARKLKPIKNPFGHIIGETFLHDLYEDYNQSNPLI